MNFFEAQDDARARTGRLVLLFAAAVLLTALLIYGAVHAALFFTAFDEKEQKEMLASGAAYAVQWHLLFVTTALVLVVVLFGALLKALALAGGGGRVAQAMGGALVPLATTDPELRRLLNVVEEMAIAAGAPVPDVYILPDADINAFAAGTTPANAAIGVTRGALRHLSREQLQGVMAHEFSHIMNGDMRLNIRMLAVVHGLLMIGLFGDHLMRLAFFAGATRPRSSYNNDSGGGGILAIGAVGVALMVAGYVGTFFGSWIRGAVSRQREFLADAAAVQYTRNPQGIAGALERIGVLGGHIQGKMAARTEADEAYLRNKAKREMAKAEFKMAMQDAGYEEGGRSPQDPHIEYSHMLFAEPQVSAFSNPFASHPPLEVRIARVMPGWSPDNPINTQVLPRQGAQADAAPPPASTIQMRQKPAGAAAVAGMAFAGALGAGASVCASAAAAGGGAGAEDSAAIAAAAIAQRIGVVNQGALARAAETMQKIPRGLQEAATDPYAARALIYAMLLDTQNAAARAAQLARLDEFADTGVAALTRRLQTDTAMMPRAARLPLAQLTLPALRRLSGAQYERFLGNLAALIAADNNIELFEWCLQAVVVHALHEVFSGERRAAAGGLADAMAYALAILALAGHGGDNARARGALSAALQEAGLPPAEATDFHPQRLFDAMQTIALARPKQKEKFARAAAACVAHDGRLDVNETTLLRAYFMMIDCPLGM